MKLTKKEKRKNKLKYMREYQKIHRQEITQYKTIWMRKKRADKKYSAKKDTSTDAPLAVKHRIWGKPKSRIGITLKKNDPKWDKALADWEEYKKTLT